MAEEHAFGRNEALFVQLLLTFQTAAYHQMGKIASPVTGRLERNLDQAQNSIDILAMIQEKTKGNLSEGEERMIDNILYELRMNFLEEQKREKEKPEEEAPETKEKPKPEEKPQKGAAQPPGKTKEEKGPEENSTS